jgi:ProP effector
MSMRKRARQTIVALAQRWPRCFAVAECRRLPLKIGIAADIVAAGFAIADVELALRFYTGSSGYKKALTAGAPRIDLDGNAVGSVSAKAAAHAESVLAKRQRRKREQAAERAAAARKTMPKRLSLADLRAAAQARKRAAAGTDADVRHELAASGADGVGIRTMSK